MDKIKIFNWCLLALLLFLKPLNEHPNEQPLRAEKKKERTNKNIKKKDTKKQQQQQRATPIRCWVRGQLVLNCE